MTRINRGDLVRHTILARSGEDMTHEDVLENWWLENEIVSQEIEVVERLDAPTLVSEELKDWRDPYEQDTERASESFASWFDNAGNDKPRPGDKVRVEFDSSKGITAIESIVDDWNGRFDGCDLVRDGIDTVTILGRADDPASDPVGTVRKDGSRSIVKVAEDKWIPVSESSDLLVRYTNHAMELEHCLVIGAVPGSPADTEARR